MKNTCFNSFVILLFLLFFIIVSCHKDKFIEPVTPVLITTNVSEITKTSAMSGGDISANGEVTIISRGVCWSINNSPTISDNKTIDGSGLGTFTSYIIGLTKGTTYHVRAYATNSSTTFYGNIIKFTTNGTVTDIDGNEYNTVTIGDQEWITENLRVTNYCNGDAIPNITNTTEWLDLGNSKVGIYCNYNNNPNNSQIYGRLYNYYAVIDSRHLCPDGWHIPSDAEWTTFENYLIGNGFNYDGTTSGNKIAKSLAASSRWVTSSEPGVPGNTDYPTYRNKTGFTALPGGHRNYNIAFPAFDKIGYSGCWWSRTSYANGAYQRYIYYDSPDLDKVGYNELSGYSVRCIKDK